MSSKAGAELWERLHDPAASTDLPATDSPAARGQLMALSQAHNADPETRRAARERLEQWRSADDQHAAVEEEIEP